MKIIAEYDTNSVFCALDDSMEISMTEDRIEVLDQDEIVLVIVCNSILDSFSVDNVDVPDDWGPHKYKYINNAFELNQDWVEPEIIERPLPVLASEIE